MPAKLKAILGTAGVAGAATLALTLALALHRGLGSPVELGGFAFVLALSWTFPLKVLRREETVAYQLE